MFRRLLWIPTWLFDLLRMVDQWGGPRSASVSRFVGPDADMPSRELQYKFNKQSRTPVFRRMAWGMLPIFSGGIPVGGMFGKPAWEGLDIPVFLVGGEKDNVTSPKEVDRVAAILEADHASMPQITDDSQTIPDSAAPVATTSVPRRHLPESIKDISYKDFDQKRDHLVVSENTFDDPTTPHDQAPASIPPQPLHPKKVVKTLILPAPATHALLFTPNTVRTLAGFIGDFLSEHVTGRFSLAWQLLHLNHEGKWDVKNLAKWKNVAPVSESIGGLFRAMKTLREVDEDHSPKIFASKWRDVVKDVIDISHDDPVYDPRGLEREGIRYVDWHLDCH
jgi:hypothetical protein